MGLSRWQDRGIDNGACLFLRQDKNFVLSIIAEYRAHWLKLHSINSQQRLVLVMDKVVCVCDGHTYGVSHQCYPEWWQSCQGQCPSDSWEPTWVWPTDWHEHYKGIGVVQITPSGALGFCRSKPTLCVAITIDKQNFSTKFDHGAKVWTATLKWTGGQVSIVLQNMIAEYPVFRLMW